MANKVYTVKKKGQYIERDYPDLGMADWTKSIYKAKKWNDDSEVKNVADFYEAKVCPVTQIFKEIK